MRRKLLIVSIIAAVLLILGIPIAAGAQDYGRYRERNYRADRRDLRDAVQRLDYSSARLQSDLNSRSGRRGFGVFWTRDNSALDSIRDFRRAVRDFRNSSNDGRNLNRSYDEARVLIARGNDLHREIVRSGNPRLDSDWLEVRRDLQTIADAYGLSLPY